MSFRVREPLAFFVLAVALLWLGAAAGQPRQAESPPDEVPPLSFSRASIAAAAIGGKGYYYTLEEESDHITQRSLRGGLVVKRFETGSTADMVVLATHDFAVDAGGGVHALIASRTHGGRSWFAASTIPASPNTSSSTLPSRPTASRSTLPETTGCWDWRSTPTGS